MPRSKKVTRTPYINPRQRRNIRGNNELEERSRGLIDKVEFYLQEQVHFNELARVAQRLGYEARSHKLKGHGYTFSVTGELNQRLSFFMFRRDGTYSRKGVVRPDDFDSYKEMKDFIISLIGRNQFECADVYRTDFAVDIPDSFEILKRYLYANRKKFCKVFLNDGSRMSGIQIGRKPEVVVMYDKALESKSTGILTRVELQMSSHCKAVEYFTQLPLLVDLVDGHYRKYFRKVSFEGSEFRDPHEIEDKDELIALVRATTLTEELGSHLARKRCKGDPYFRYSDFVQCHPYPVDLDKVLMRDLCYFFGKPERAKVLQEFWDDDY